MTVTPSCDGIATVISLYNTCSNNYNYKSRGVAGMTARCRCEFRYLLKFTAKIWEVPGYAHAPISPQFLRGLCSRGPSECTCQI